MERPVRTSQLVTSRRFVMERREAPVMRWVTRVVIVAIWLNIGLFSWSIYRRVFQVLRIELQASNTVLTPGVTVSTDVVTSGEVPNPIRLELVQGTHSEMLLERRGGLPLVSSYDPRLFRYTPSVVITAELLGRFTPGPATLRLTGVGMQKLLHIPPPRIRELQVILPRR